MRLRAPLLLCVVHQYFSSGFNLIGERVLLGDR